MSSLLEQAIIDAAALKEAAIKNAETAILNKYSADIKEVVENLFEQEEDAEEEGPEKSEESETLEDSIPYGIDEPEGVQESEIVLSMEELKDMAEVLASAEEDLMGDQIPHEELADTMDPPEMPGEPEVSSTEVQATLEEEVDISDLEDLLEELVVDIEPQKSGWAGTPEDIMQYKEEMKLAQLAATQAKEENLELAAAAERLSEQNDKMRKIISVLKEKVEKANLTNAKLLYTNRLFREFALSNNQKLKIVETFDRAQTTREIKLVYSTLAESYKDNGGERKEVVKESYASKKSGGTAPKTKIITEESQVADRFRKLAGLKS